MGEVDGETYSAPGLGEVVHLVRVERLEEVGRLRVTACKRRMYAVDIGGNRGVEVV